MYFSLFGPRGLALGALARFVKRPVEVLVEVPGLIHPVYLRLRTTDIELSRTVLLEAQYEQSFSRCPRVIVDAGANIGLASVFYANEFPGAKIVAIEPERCNFDILKRNLRPYGNTFAIHAALWHRNEELQLLDTGAGSTAFQTCRPAKRQGGQLVRGITLRTLMEELGLLHVDLLKVDIEGSERMVFGSSSEWIENVGIIAVEIHEGLQPGSTETVRQAAKVFPRTWNKGEITYFAKEEYISTDLLTKVGRRRIGSQRPPSSRFPAKILRRV